MSLQSRVPSIRNWCSTTNRELTWRLMQLARIRPELYAEFKAMEAKRICNSLNERKP